MRRLPLARATGALLGALLVVAALANLGCRPAGGAPVPAPPPPPQERPQPAPPPDPGTFDLVLAGGQVYDGTGAPPRRADVGIRGDRIAAVGNLAGARAARRIDVAGLAVAPGFIDPHSHTWEYGDPYTLASVAQGITTQIGGVDGRSDGYGYDPRPRDVAEAMAFMERRGTGVNQAIFAGLGTLRRQVMGSANQRPATPAEVEQMGALLRKAMADGALGLSTGLEYNPDGFAPTAEVIALARIAAELGGVYATHIRYEKDNVLAGVEEALRIGREAGIPLALQHFKFSGPENWTQYDQTVSLLQAAVAAGQPVLADVYGYQAPDWAAHWPVANAFGTYGRWPEIIIIEKAGDSSLLGLSLAQAAGARNTTPAELARRLAAEGGRATAEVIRLEHLLGLLRQDWVAVSSDGEASPLLDPGRALLEVHPRSYGNYPRLLRLNREQGVLPLEQLIRKMTGQVADFYRLKDRGYVREGALADLVAFDPAAVRETATWWNPQGYPEGIRYTLVNGVPVVDSGSLTRLKPGRMLRRVQ